MKKQANRAVLKMLRDGVTALPRRPFGRYLLVFLCGAGASLALPPAGFLPAALFFSVPVVLAVNEARPLRGALLFAAAGFGWFAVLFTGLVMHYLSRAGCNFGIAFCLFGFAPVTISFLG